MHFPGWHAVCYVYAMTGGLMEREGRIALELLGTNIIPLLFTRTADETDVRRLILEREAGL